MVEYLPASAQLVFSILTSDGPLTQKDLIRKTELPPRTVRYALSRLKEESVIKECFYLQLLRCLLILRQLQCRLWNLAA